MLQYSTELGEDMVASGAATPDINIVYDDRSGDGAALMFMPGWCGDRTVFGPLLEALPQGRRAIALDWRGHGESTRDVPDFGNTDLVEDALQVIERAGVRTVIPIALSHAGWVAIELCRRLGAAAVPGVVLLDWMVLGPPPGFDDALRGLQQPGAWQEVRSTLFAMWTSAVSNPAVLDYVASMGGYGQQHWSRAGREISAAFATESTPLQALESLATASAACQTLHLYAQPDHPALLTAQLAYAAVHPWFRVARLEARSHFPMLEIPQQMATLIDSFATEVTADGPPRSVMPYEADSR